MKIILKSVRMDRGTLAFTLIEVLLAIAILGGIMTAIFSSWTAILRASKVGLDAAAEAQRERITQDCVATAISSAVLFQQNLQYYAFVADTSNDRFAYLSLVAHLPDTFLGARKFANVPLRRVTFSVEATNGASALIMEQTKLLVPANTVDADYRMVLADDITRFMVEFWDTNLNDWNSDWVLSNQLPQMVKVTLGFAKKNKSGYGTAPESDLYSVVSVSGTTVTPDIQIGTGGLGLPPVRPVVRPIGTLPATGVGQQPGINGQPNNYNPNRPPTTFGGNGNPFGGGGGNVYNGANNPFSGGANVYGGGGPNPLNPNGQNNLNQLRPPTGVGPILRRYTNGNGIVYTITTNNGVAQTNIIN